MVMNTKTLWAALILGLSAASASAQDFNVDLQPLAEAKKTISSWKERLAPAKVDNKHILTLMTRLAESGDTQKTPKGLLHFFIGTNPLANGEDDPILSVALLEQEVPLTPADVHDLLIRRQFSQMRVSSRREIARPGSTREIEEWTYTLGLDGTILQVEHSLGLPGSPGRPAIVGESSGIPLVGFTGAEASTMRSYRLPPQDPAVLKRWKRLQKAVLLLSHETEA